MSDSLRVLEEMGRDFPNDVKLLVQEVLTENKNLIDGVADDRREAAAMERISDAIGNIINNSPKGIDELSEVTLGEDSPRAMISMELSAMSKRVAQGHTAKSTRTTLGGQER